MNRKAQGLGIQVVQQQSTTAIVMYDNDDVVEVMTYENDEEVMKQIRVITNSD